MGERGLEASSLLDVLLGGAEYNLQPPCRLERDVLRVRQRSWALRAPYLRDAHDRCGEFLRSAAFVVEAARRAGCSSLLLRCRPLVCGVGAGLSVPPGRGAAVTRRGRQELHHFQLSRPRAASAYAAIRLERVACVEMARSAVQQPRPGAACVAHRTEHTAHTRLAAEKCVQNRVKWVRNAKIFAPAASNIFREKFSPDFLITPGPWREPHDNCDPTAQDRYHAFRLRHYLEVGILRVHTQKQSGGQSPLATLGHTHTPWDTHQPTTFAPTTSQGAVRTYLLSHWLLGPGEPLTSMLRAATTLLTPRQTTTGPPCHPLRLLFRFLRR